MKRIEAITWGALGAGVVVLLIVMLGKMSMQAQSSGYYAAVVDCRQLRGTDDATADLCGKLRAEFQRRYRD